MAVDDTGAAAAVGLPGSDLTSEIVANAHELGIGELHLRYVDGEPAGSNSAVRSQYGADAWLASVQVSYLLPVDPRATNIEMAFVFVADSSHRARIAAVGGYGKRSALWLEGPIQVRRNTRALVVTAADQPIRRYWRLAKRAVQDVERVLGSRPKTLVFEVPQGQRQLEELTGVPAGADKLVGGVTASVDGVYAPGAPLHSFFNADVFDREGARGAQLIVTHEATLQATRAPLTSMPLWLKEGFADYVALIHSEIPLSSADKHIVAETRRSGPPASLPTEADFDPTHTDLDHLNAVYEASWLACRYIAESRSESTLLNLYDALGHGGRPSVVFRRILGTDLAEFVVGWRGYLAQLAHIGVTGASGAPSQTASR